MQELLLVLSVVLIHLLAVMSPGPDFLVIIKYSLSHSRSTGIWMAIGIGLGIMVHISYSLVGLGIIINQSPLLYDTIKYLGAAYLFYLGIMSFFSRSAVGLTYESDNNKPAIMSPFKALRIGFLTNVLNPKATLFFLSLFTLVISPETSIVVMVIISFLLVFDTILWFVLLATLITHRKIIKIFYKYQGLFNKIFGVLLIALALKIVC